jgi:hypothetical protein
VGCGADELIDLLMRCVLEPGDRIVDSPPTFTMYAFDADVNNAQVGADSPLLREACQAACGIPWLAVPGVGRRLHWLVGWMPGAGCGRGRNASVVSMHSLGSLCVQAPARGASRCSSCSS